MAGTGIVADPFVAAVQQLCRYTLKQSAFDTVLAEHNPHVFKYLASHGEIYDGKMERNHAVLDEPLRVIRTSLTKAVRPISAFTRDVDLSNENQWREKIQECLRRFEPAFALIKVALIHVHLEDGTALTVEQQEQFAIILRAFIAPVVGSGRGSAKIKTLAEHMLDENDLDPSADCLAGIVKSSPVAVRTVLSPRTRGIVAAHHEGDSPLSASPTGSFGSRTPHSPISRSPTHSSPVSSSRARDGRQTSTFMNEIRAREQRAWNAYICYLVISGLAGAAGGAFIARAQASERTQVAWTGGGAAIGFTVLALVTALLLTLKEHCTPKTFLVPGAPRQERSVRGYEGVLRVVRHGVGTSASPFRPTQRQPSPVVRENPFHAHAHRSAKGVHKQRGFTAG